jgi:hypothetical protein
MEILGEKLAKIEAEEIEQSAREEAAKRMIQLAWRFLVHQKHSALAQ